MEVEVAVGVAAFVAVSAGLGVSVTVAVGVGPLHATSKASNNPKSFFMCASQGQFASTAAEELGPAWPRERRKFPGSATELYIIRASSASANSCQSLLLSAAYNRQKR
jgi:hypothetical protein